VLRFRVRRYTRTPRLGPLDDGLDQLVSLQFVRGGYDAQDYWSLVQHCRKSAPADPLTGTPGVVNDHRRPPNGWYQLVSGPVAAFWKQRALMAGSDQFSFTRAARTCWTPWSPRGRARGRTGPVTRTSIPGTW